MRKIARRDETLEPMRADDIAFADRSSVIPAIDALIARYAGRGTVGGPEVVDALLDLRSLAEMDELVASGS
jgi:hypothetical protein